MCFPCHGPDSAARKGDYRLDRRDDAIGKKVIVPGKPDESEMMRRILSADAEEVMPPPAIKKTLTAKQKQMVHVRAEPDLASLVSRLDRTQMQITITLC